MPIIPAFGKPRQEEHAFEVSSGYIVRLSLRSKQIKEKKNIPTSLSAVDHIFKKENQVQDEDYNGEKKRKKKI